MNYLIGIIVALLGALYFTNGKKKSAEALIQNLNTNEDLNTKDKSIAENNGLIQSEEDKRKQIEGQKQDDQESIDDLNNFFNDRK